jgi:hypothetical protein
MKIIQLVTAVNGESPGSFESQLLGLGDDGGLYEWVIGRSPQAINKYSAYLSEQAVKAAQEDGSSIRFIDGTTQGWQLICMSIDRPKVIPHPLDPTRTHKEPT